jgi:hypothetical protein
VEHGRAASMPSLQQIPEKRVMVVPTVNKSKFVNPSTYLLSGSAKASELYIHPTEPPCFTRKLLELRSKVEKAIVTMQDKNKTTKVVSGEHTVAGMVNPLKIDKRKRSRKRSLVKKV